MTKHDLEREAIKCLSALQCRFGHDTAVFAVMNWMNGVTIEGFDTLIRALQAQRLDIFKISNETPKTDPQ